MYSYSLSIYISTVPPASVRIQGPRTVTLGQDHAPTIAVTCTSTPSNPITSLSFVSVSAANQERSFAAGDSAVTAWTEYAEGEGGWVTTATLQMPVDAPEMTVKCMGSSDIEDEIMTDQINVVTTCKFSL